MAKNVLAFDFGASNGRAMLVSCRDGKMEMTEVHRFPNDTVILGDRMYWDFPRLMYEVKQAILKAVKLSKIDAIGIDTWGVDFGLIDRYGELISNPVHYRDTRTEGLPAEVAGILPEKELYARTGSQTMRINTLYQLYYLRKMRPDILACADKILFIPDLIAYFLTGKMRCEKTIASTSNFLDPVRREPDSYILEALGISPSLIAPMINAGEIYGNLSDKICAELSCESIPVIAVCTHDTASAVAAAPAKGDFVYISCGTWSLFGTELPAPLINEKSLAAQYTNEGGYNSTRFLKNIMGLWLIQESRRHWLKQGENVTYADLEREATAAEPFRCFIDCDAPEFETSGDIPGRVSEFCRVTGQFVPKTRGEIMRCIYESLAMKYKLNFEKLSDLTGKNYKTINMFGGGIKDTFLCRMTASSTGATVIAGPAEATVMGNAAVQLISLGEIKSLEDAREMIRNSTELKTYLPDDPETWNAVFPEYKKYIGASALK